MSERYISLFTGDKDLYVDNAPVIIKACALLKDTVTGRMTAQLKIQNVSGKTISYVKACVTPLDTVRTRLGEPQQYEYMDLSVTDRQEFGSEELIFLPDTSTRSFLVGICDVAFADGTVWTCDDTDWKAAEAAKKKKKALKLSAFIAVVCILLGAFGYFALYPWISVQTGHYDVYIKMYNIKKYEIPDGVTSIDERAFAGCASLTDIYIPDSVTRICNRAFEDCTSLTDIAIPDSVTDFGRFVFFGCTGLTGINIPDSFTRIGDHTFYGCTSLTGITVPDSVKGIDDCAFYECTSLTDITIPDSVMYIGDRAFDGCTSLTTVYYGGTASDWSDVSFASDNDALTDATCYYYSETRPGTSGNYWHYVDGVATVWK